jgi:glutathionylspermidine synthase
MDDFLNDKQKEAVAFFKKNLDSWADDPLYKYKYVVIRENAMVGIFDTYGVAITEAVSKYPENDFIIQQIISNKDFVNFLSPAIA